MKKVIKILPIVIFVIVFVAVLRKNRLAFLDFYFETSFYKEKYASYYTSSSMSTYLGSSSVGHFWSATPWNYSYPAPCRTLVNTYPA